MLVRARVLGAGVCDPWAVRDRTGQVIQHHTKPPQRTVDACALGRDLTLLEAGDLTEIGEKGVNLSGALRGPLAVWFGCACSSFHPPLSPRGSPQAGSSSASTSPGPCTAR